MDIGTVKVFVGVIGWVMFLGGGFFWVHQMRREL